MEIVSSRKIPYFDDNPAKSIEGPRFGPFPEMSCVLANREKYGICASDGRGVVGILTITLSVTQPAFAVSQFRHKEIVIISDHVVIAALADLRSFFRWERTWHGKSAAQVALEQLVAKWELELTRARLVVESN
jgi:hypothetical protein